MSSWSSGTAGGQASALLLLEEFDKYVCALVRIGERRQKMSFCERREKNRHGRKEMWGGRGA